MTTTAMTPETDFMTSLKSLLGRNVAEGETLNELVRRYHQIEEALIESGGLAEYGDLLDEVECDIEKKLDNCKGLVDYWKGQIAYLDEREKTFKSRKAGIKAGVEWLRQSMAEALKVAGLGKVKTFEGTYYFTKPRLPVKVDPALINKKYAHALRVTGLAKRKVIVTFNDDGAGTWSKYADELQAATGCTVEVGADEYDINGLAERYQGTARKWPPYLRPGDPTFTIR